jgi:hydroxyacylglutathione hydrolase
MESRFVVDDAVAVDVDDDDDDDAPSPLSSFSSYVPSPCATFARDAIALALACVVVSIRALALALAPVRALTPSIVSRAARRAAFACGYAAYAGALGRAIHARMIAHAKGREAHARAGAPVACGSCVVVTIPFLNDNYCYLVIDGATRTCAAIDPADAERVARTAETLGVKITHALTTHKHHDHAGGNAALVEIIRRESAEREGEARELIVYGHERDACHGANARARDGGVIHVGETRVLATHVPCHTLGHVTYAVMDARAPRGEESLEHAVAMFTGDAIINGGVGAFFHGDAGDCYDNLHERLAPTPDACLIFSGHEYMEMNLRFAKMLDDDDEITANAFYAILLHRHRDFATMPSSFRVERRLNPFFRCRERAYLKRLLEKKRALMERKTRPWWHRYFGAQGSRLEAQRARMIERHPLAIRLREDETSEPSSTVASRAAGACGIDLVQDLMGDLFAVGASVKTGDEEEHENFMLYARAMSAQGNVRVVPSELVG